MLAIILLFVLASGASALAVKAAPDQFTLDAMLNAPVVFQLEVTAESSLGAIELRADGLRIQREVKTLAPNRKMFLIEPDTSVTGRVSGQINVVDEKGNSLCSVPITGVIKPYIRVSPGRVFLGSLEYGTRSGRILEKRFRMSGPGDWKILHVDISQIAAADYEVTEVAADTKELILRIPEDSLKAGEPFGAFINRAIRIVTNNPAQPEVSISITTMLSRNGTDRDFNTFVFKGKQRWQGRWATPNIAAAVLGPLILLVLGYGVWLLRIRTRPPIFWRIVAALLCLAALAGMVLLVKTYSRGGWVAFGVGLAAMIVLMKGCRRHLAFAAIAFALIVIALPAGIQRAASAGAVLDDGSIRNRLLVWGGALEMIADHPVSGVGVGKFGEVFQNYYQEPWHKASYSTAVNDYLTFAAERGLVLVLVTVALGAFVAVVSMLLMREHADLWAAPVICALITICASSLFSSIEFVREARILAFAGAAALFTYGVGRAFLVRGSREIERRIALRNVWVRGTFAALLAGCIFGGTVAWAGFTRAVLHVASENSGGTDGLSSRIEYLPGKNAPRRGTVLFLAKERGPLTVIGRQVLRPLAQNGWRAISLDLPAYDQEAIVVVTDVLQRVEGPILILAEGSKARVAMGAARRMVYERCPQVGLIQPVLFSVLPECDQSHDFARLAHRTITVDTRKWQSYKQDSRNGARPFVEALEAQAGIPETPQEDQRLATSDPAFFSAESPEKSIK